jgi:hypothetical protein
MGHCYPGDIDRAAEEFGRVNGPDPWSSTNLPCYGVYCYENPRLISDRRLLEGIPQIELMKMRDSEKEIVVGLAEQAESRV